MKLNCISGESFGCGQFAPTGTSTHLKPRLVYSFVASGFLRSQCSATARHPQDLAFASAFAISLVAIPFRRNLSRTATFDMYAIPVLARITMPQMQLWRSRHIKCNVIRTRRQSNDVPSLSMRSFSREKIGHSIHCQDPSYIPFIQAEFPIKTSNREIVTP